jgi:hypothetical protein
MKLPPNLTAQILSTPGVVIGPGSTWHAPAVEMDEKTFQAAVVALAKRSGWKKYHTHDSRKSDAGFPDLLLVRERVIFAELKTESGRLTADQLNWRDWLLAAKAEWYCWRPSDWAGIVEILA